MQVPKILKPFLKLTAEEKTPTDIQLDHDIEYVSYIIYNIWPILKKIIRNKIKRYFWYRWKFIFGRIVIFSLILFLSYIAFVKVFHVRMVEVETPNKEVFLSYPHDSSMNLRNFLIQIAYGESRYNKGAHRDSSQYLGLFQIGKNERKITGYGDIPDYIYLNHEEIQIISMIRLLKYNKKYMQGYINKYSGKIVDGILVTESGILALCQLGCGYTRQCLDGGTIPPNDGNGNNPRRLLSMGGYKLKLDDITDNVVSIVDRI
jgi:hypothetical protein